jgi:hypothetical protein
VHVSKSKSQLMQIREAVDGLGQRMRGHRFPEALRSEIIAWVGAERRRGRSWSEVSRALGIRTTTLRRWGLTLQSSQIPRARPVVVAPSEPPPLRLSLVGPAGWRLEGLSLDDACRLLASLSC